jgi:hypothetical protein
LIRREFKDFLSAAEFIEERVKCIDKMNVSKGKFVAVHNLKAYKGSGGIAPHMFNLGV